MFLDSFLSVWFVWLQHQPTKLCLVDHGNPYRQAPAIGPAVIWQASGQQGATLPRPKDPARSLLVGGSRYIGWRVPCSSRWIGTSKRDAARVTADETNGGNASDKRHDTCVPGPSAAR